MKKIGFIYVRARSTELACVLDANNRHCRSVLGPNGTRLSAFAPGIQLPYRSMMGILHRAKHPHAAR